ncbi:MAG: DUF4199 domain-containing protein [Bacteroidota bacterium]
MTEEEKNAEINKLSVRNGVLVGIVSIILTIVFHIIDPLLQFVNIGAQLGSFAIVITLIIILALEVRKKIGGFWTFGQAFRSLIIGGLFITLLSVACNFVMFKFVDPSLPGKIKDATVEKVTDRLTKMGMEQSKIDEINAQFENGEFEAKLQPTFKNELTAVGIGLLIYAIIDLIIAAIIKKNPPMFAPVPDELDPTV